MPLSSGTRLGVFHIDSVLGIGGMGEVYLATDTKLKRQVAIKILPVSLVADTARLARFEREAEMLASINHPNIAAVFGIEDTSAGKAIVMELVEGADLRATLQHKTPPVPEALAIAQQLARAIGAAHRRGIVHRDLKPANIMLRPDGTLKVLDFGLAKTSPASTSNHDDTVTATIAGTVMGTPRYMSPEQARGEAADTQSDIWAFGVILYELLTGRPPFDASSAETLSKVLTAEPDFDRLPADLPPRIRLLIERCLRKDPSRRLHHIGDAALDLDDAMASGATESKATRRAALPMLAVAAIVAGLVGAAIGGWLMRPVTPDVQGTIRAEVTVPDPPMAQPYGIRTIAISPDGSRIVATTRTALHIRRIDGGDSVELPVRAHNPFFSPDGKWIAFFELGASGRPGLKKVAVTGGTTALIAETSERPLGGDWRSDGTVVFATTSGLFLVRDDGSQLKPLAKPDAAAGQRVLAWPQFLPGLDTILFTIMPNGPVDGAQIALMDLKTSRIENVLIGTGARYVSTGHLVYASGPQLKRVAFDPRRPQTADVGTVVEGITVSVAADNGAADFAISRSGTLIFAQTQTPAAASGQLIWIDRQGREEPIALPPGRYGLPRVSPDGTQVVVDMPGANRDVWLYDLRRGNLAQLTFGPTEDMLPAWSHDGQRVFFASDRRGNFDIFSRAADGATPERLEFSSPATEMPISFSPDGTRLFIVQEFRDVAFLAAPTFERAEPVLNSAAQEGLTELSPDGKWIAYESNETGRSEVFIRPFPDVAARREKVSTAGGRFPLWSPAGNGELFYVTADGHMMSASIAFSPSLSVRGETKLFDVARPPQSLSGRPYDFSARHGRFIVYRATTTGPSETRIALVVNWLAQFRKN